MDRVRVEEGRSRTGGSPIKSDTTPGNQNPEDTISYERGLRDREARDYDEITRDWWWNNGVFDRAFRSSLRVETHHTVMDAGCGTGRHLPWLARSAEHVWGVDLSPESLKVAKDRLDDEFGEDPMGFRDKVDLIPSDLRTIPVEDSSCDRLMCAGVFHHIPGEESRAEALREFHRILRPDGIAAIWVFRWGRHIRKEREGFYENGPYRYAFTLPEIRARFEQAGFRHVEAGGACILPRISKNLNLSPALHARLIFTPVGKLLGDFAFVRAVK